MTSMDLTTTNHTQRQMQLDQLGDDQYNLRNKLQAAIKNLKSAEADIATMLGFEWHAANLQKSC